MKQYVARAKAIPDISEDAATRFWAKVNLLGDCWLWTAAQSGKGYGAFYYGGRTIGAHRVAWALTYGDPSDLTLVIDHLCKTPLCVNPAHMELVTNGENVRRSNLGKRHPKRRHCKRGHEYTQENTYVYGNIRICKQCRRDYDRKRR